MSEITMSVFHMNIGGLSAHHDELSLHLAGLKFRFDVIGISETKEQSDKGFLSNVHLPGYNIHTRPTKSSAGGVALYLNSSLNYKARDDLSVTKMTLRWSVSNSSLKQKKYFVLCLQAPKH